MDNKPKLEGRRKREHGADNSFLPPLRPKTKPDGNQMSAATDPNDDILPPVNNRSKQPVVENERTQLRKQVRISRYSFIRETSDDNKENSTSTASLKFR